MQLFGYISSLPKLARCHQSPVRPLFSGVERRQGTHINGWHHAPQLLSLLMALSDLEWQS